MTLNELRYVVAVARERHFGRAAEACFVSQPTLSVAVRKLEDELGVSLFERGTGEVTITPAGERILTQAQRVLDEAEEVRSLARQGSDPLVGSLRLGVIPTVGPYLLPRLVPSVMDSAPRMPLFIEEYFKPSLCQRLKRDDLDVLLISLPCDEPGILTRPLYDESFFVLVPSGHPWAVKGEVDVRSLGDERVLLLGPGHCFRDQVLQVCPNCLRQAAGAGNGSQRTLEGGSLETIRCMVASGVGVTVMPCTAMAAQGFPEDLVSALPFAGKAPSRRIGLAWRKSFPRVEAVDVLDHAVRAAGMMGVRYL